MVDDVHITGSEVEWALEKTQDQILDLLKRAYKLDEKTAKETTKQLKTAADNGGLFGEKGKKAFKQLTDGVNKSAVASFKQGKAQKSLTETTKGLNKEFQESSKSFKTAMVGMGLVGNVLGRVYKRFMDTVGVLAELTDSGISYNMTSMQLSRTLANVGMSLEQFQAISQRYSTVMSSMGIPRFNSLIDEVQSLSKNFNTFGLTSAEGAEWAAEYLEQQRSLGNFSIYTQRNLNEAVRSNVERLTAYSKILNVSRSELQDAQTKAAQNAMVQSRFYAMSAELAGKAEDAYVDVIAQLTARNAGDDAIASLFEEMFAYENIEQSPAYQRARQTGAQGFIDVLQDMHEGVSNGVKPGIEMYARLGAEIDNNKDTLYSIAQADQSLAGDLNAYLKYGKNFKESLARGTFATDSSTNALVSVTAKLNENLKKLSETTLHLANKTLENFIKLIGGKGNDATAYSAMDSIANAAGRAAKFLLDLADGKTTWGEVFAKLGTLIWDTIGKGFDATIAWLGSIIRTAINDLIYTIETWSPFSKTDTQRRHGGKTERDMGAMPGSLGLNAFKLQDARKRLEGAQANVYQAAQNAASRPGVEKYEAHLAEKESEARVAATMVQELVLARRAIEKLNATTEEGNG